MLSLPLDIAFDYPFLTDYVCNPSESLDPNESYWNERQTRLHGEQDTTRERIESGTPSGKNHSPPLTAPSHHTLTPTLPTPIQRIERYIDFYRLLMILRVTSSTLLPQSLPPNPSLNLPQPQFVPLRNLFGTDSELRDEKTFAELIGTPILLSPLVKLPTLEEDISCTPTTINLLDTIAELRSLFPILSELPSSTTSPTPSFLLAAEDYPVSPYQDLTHPDTPIRVIDDSFTHSSWSVPEVEEGPPVKKTRIRAREARKTKKDQSTKRC